MSAFCATLALVSFIAVRAAAEGTAFAPMRELSDGGAAPTGNGATLWLIVASVAMVAALYAAHWSVFRRK